MNYKLFLVLTFLLAVVVTSNSCGSKKNDEAKKTEKQPYILYYFDHPVLKLSEGIANKIDTVRYENDEVAFASMVIDSYYKRGHLVHEKKIGDSLNFDVEWLPINFTYVITDMEGVNLVNKISRKRRNELEKVAISTGEEMSVREYMIEGINKFEKLRKKNSLDSAR
jgi:hypothetical protein